MKAWESEWKVKINYSTLRMYEIMSRIAQYCRNHDDCETCYFRRAKTDDCALAQFANNEPPCEWVNEQLFHETEVRPQFHFNFCGWTEKISGFLLLILLISVIK